LVTEQQVVPANGAHEFTQIVGWHPKEKHLVLFQFHGDGGAAIGKITRLGRDGAKWIGEVGGIAPSGVEITMTLTRTFYGSGACKVEFSDVKVDGKAVNADLPAAVFEKR